MGRDQTRIALVAAILAMAIPASAYADHPSYVVQDLGALPADQGVSQAYAINNSGQVVGAGSGGGSASWIWDQHNGIRSLGAFPGGDGNTRATAINDAGVVVGFAEIQGFFWTATAGMEPIPGVGQQSDAFGINNPGAIVGGFAGVSGNGFLWKNGKVTALGVLPGSQPPISIAYGINNRARSSEAAAAHRARARFCGMPENWSIWGRSLALPRLRPMRSAKPETQSVHPAMKLSCGVLTKAYRVLASLIRLAFRATHVQSTMGERWSVMAVSAIQPRHPTHSFGTAPEVCSI
jgi:probable HAF family extracellular repeat protein